VRLAKGRANCIVGVRLKGPWYLLCSGSV
jgi:hypothetical protein